MGDPAYPRGASLVAASRAAIAFAQELDRLYVQFAREWDLTYVEAVGCLHYAATLLVLRSKEEAEEPEEPDA